MLACGFRADCDCLALLLEWKSTWWQGHVSEQACSLHHTIEAKRVWTGSGFQDPLQEHIPVT